MPADGSLIMPRLALFTFVVLFFISATATPVPAQSSQELLEKAQTLNRNGFLDEAAVVWEKLATTDTDPNRTVYARLMVGNTYLKLQQFQKSIDTMEAIAQSHPDNFDAHFHLANSLNALKKFPEAITAFEKTTALRSEEGLGYVGLGLSLFGNRDSKKAIEALLKANKLFKLKKNISWYRDTRVMVAQIKHFAKFPPSFSDLWLTNTLKLVRDTYEKSVFTPKQYLH